MTREQALVMASRHRIFSAVEENLSPACTCILHLATPDGNSWLHLGFGSGIIVRRASAISGLAAWDRERLPRLHPNSNATHITACKLRSQEARIRLTAEARVKHFYHLTLQNMSTRGQEPAIWTDPKAGLSRSG
ncbi:uncharacterized protein MYCFIDRAFT_176446 [Pseudocercospora fijiensis CIRAD86]|uniref:Uncharacterized protein n=1 Tax=Pseudocercospora fijiensis (strain CIRAD86) TaxID=383855 RepID=M2ZPY0_PSEFD|nr:uncharacterized protein MYCFIDRAFT_176446 [Pseudocercospora fijiensis CIRAD86]EME81134.1 hypothetical protein MYCFIDRAFT_176446 [Pseudocercospora fijiensis CIRAD86]